MSSFQKLWEAVRENRGGPDDKSQSAIRTGIGVREDFWEDFLLVINNSDGLSDLLGVPSHRIATWHGKVKAALDDVRQADSRPEPNDKGKLLKTGLPERQPRHTQPEGV